MALLQAPKRIDTIVLSIFAILITLQPFYLYGEINWYELGIYLPGINAFLDGLVPYKDFFHLRGPLELYIPAFFMSFAGENVAILATYFYIGTVLTLLITVAIAKNVFRTRLVLYLIVPVLIGRTFPRVVFTFWGGMRYGFGLLAVLFAVYFLKNQKRRWLICSGITAVLGGLTSIEVGVCAFTGVILTFILGWVIKQYNAKFVLHSVGVYILGIFIGVFSHLIYLIVTGSFFSYIEATRVVVMEMTKVFPDRVLEHYPGTIPEILTAMLPWNAYFKLLTPAYCYLFFFGFFIFKIRNKSIDTRTMVVVGIALYGLIMYMTTFRKLMASQFEMALQPEKIVLFFMLEEALFFLRDRKNDMEALLKNNLSRVRPVVLRTKIYGIMFLIFAFVASSIFYAMSRYNKRFFAFKYLKYAFLKKDPHSLMPLAGQETEKMTLTRVKGMVVPSWQAKDIKQLSYFFDRHTKPNEAVFMFPELGFYSFIIDRPFIGRFPMVTFSWMSDWHDELINALDLARPRFAVLSKDPGPTFPKAHFTIAENKRKYDEIAKYIHDHYVIVDSTPSLWIYQRTAKAGAEHGER